MAFKPILVKAKPVNIHKAAINPDFTSKTVLATDTWDYVAMWLKRNHKEEGLFYWQQAENFFRASKQLPNTASPLTAYYCFLNATKALLAVKGVPSAELHGLKGKTLPGKTSLTNEVVSFQASGLANALSKYLYEPTNQQDYSLKDIFYNLVYIHRAYNLTFQSQPELFIPITRPVFVRKQGSNESWFCAEIADPRYKSLRTLQKVSNQFEKDEGVEDKFIIRKKTRFRWEGKTASADNLQRLTNYHRTLRRQVHYIYGQTRLWYLKRSRQLDGLIDRSSLSLTLWAMHRLSELARYTPVALGKHFESRHNWLLSEFISTAIYQFIDGISAEITGQEFMVPGRR